MLKVLPLTALALGLSSGAAFADRGHGDHRGGVEHRNGAVVRDHRGDSRGSDHNFRGNVVVRDHGNFRGNVVVRDRGNFHGGGRVFVRGEPRFRNHYVRRPIFVSRPYIGHRYYNYYQRPSLIIENYGPRDGYYWVRGQWTWDGYEWIWQPGHYEPDPNYTGAYYDNGYYDNF